MATTRQSPTSQRPRPTQKSKPPLIMRLIFHPMFYLAILAHGALLAIPGGPEEEVPPEVEEIDEIEITMLPAIIEPIPEVEVEIPEDPEPAPPPPEPIPPAPEPIPPAPSPEPIQDAPPEVPEDAGESDETNEDGKDDNGDDQNGEEQGPQTTAAALDILVTTITAIVQGINRGREDTTQIDFLDGNSSLRYSHPIHYLIDPTVKINAEYKPGVIQHTVNDRFVPVVLDDINPDEFKEELDKALAATAYTTADVSDKLEEYDATDPSRNDILLALQSGSDVLFYLALARPKAGRTVVVVPWSANSFAEDTP